MNKIKIAVVVVTYNRLELLKECVESIRNQSYKVDEIIVVNNSSTDGTIEWLNYQKDLTIITQENLGGAGGFYTGIRSAYERGYDWIWCMDDDCLVESSTLSELLYCSIDSNKKIMVIGPVLKDSTNRDVLASDIYIEVGEKKYFADSIKKAYELNNNSPIVKGTSTFFNAVLINRYVIKKVGYPNKELFIWGDEVEYAKRILCNGFDLFTCLNAIIFHPSHKWKTKRGMFNHFVYIGPASSNSFYFFRNTAYLAKKYNKGYNLKFIVAQLLYYLLYSKQKVTNIRHFIRSYYSGLKFEIKEPLK